MNNEILWTLLLDKAKRLASDRPELRRYLENILLDQPNFESALAAVLGRAIATIDPALPDFTAEFASVMTRHREISDSAVKDLDRLVTVNPACPDLLCGFLTFRGFRAVQQHRIAHALWHEEQRQFAILLQNWSAQVYSVDIHPAARIGQGVFFDHAMGVVIGETAIVEDGVNIWHGVTLGSTLTKAGDRHPKVRRNATISTGATILGNIEIGRGAVVAASSVVLEDVPAGAMVAGAPAKMVGQARDLLAISPERPPQAGIGGKPS